MIADRRVYAAGRRRDPDMVLRFRDEALLHLDSPDERTPWWAAWLTKDFVDAVTGRAWLACDQPSRAVPYLRRRVEATTLAYPHDCLHAVLDLAGTTRQCGEDDQARELLGQAERLIGAVSSQRLAHRFESPSSPAGWPGWRPRRWFRNRQVIRECWS